MMSSAIAGQGASREHPNFYQFRRPNKGEGRTPVRRDPCRSIPQARQTMITANASSPRAFILLKSGGRLDLLHPNPNAWTHADIAVGLSRTYRWGGYSKWPLPLSVAQHSLAVLALREAEGPLTAREALRELLHDASEALFGFDCISPLKPHLGPEFESLERRLQAAVDQRYELPPWSEDSYSRHKHADRLAAANEAYHIAG